MGALDNTSHNLNPTDHGLLKIMSPTYIFNEAHEFQKGIKCHIMLCPIVKDDWQSNSWYHDTHAIAFVHGTEDVFDSHYSLTKSSQAL